MNIIHKDVNKLITVENPAPVKPPVYGVGFTIWERSHESEFALANIFGVYMDDIDVFVESWTFDENRFFVPMFHDFSSIYDTEYECLKGDFPDTSDEYLHKEAQKYVDEIKEKYKQESVGSCYTKVPKKQNSISENGNWDGLDFIWRIKGSSWVLMTNSEWASFGKVNQKKGE